MDADQDAHGIGHLSCGTLEVYDRNAGEYCQRRDKSLFERSWLQRAVADVPQKGAVLDLGCGGGDPIGVWLSSQGFDLTGCDFSPAMVQIFADRLPDARAVCADMRDLQLDMQFHAIIGWGSFFHLTPDEQRLALPDIADHLAPGGRLLLTVGPDAGEVTGRVAGQDVYHASLSAREYSEVLARAGAPVETFVANDTDCNGFSFILARKPLD